MSDETQNTPAPEPASGAPEQPATAPAPKIKRTRAKATPAGAKTKSAKAKSASAQPRKTKTAVKSKTKTTVKKQSAESAAVPVNLTEPIQGPISEPISEPIQDPIGDVTSGEARTSVGPDAEPESAALMEAYRADTTSDAEHGLPEVAASRIDHPGTQFAAESAAPLPPAEAEQTIPDKAPAVETESPTQPPAKLERLQKILSQAGVASRRRAEEMIVEGRVMVNGQVVTTLGAKADPSRDHIRVDGKLLHGPERHRTFVLNKPKGYVTTVDDPEGRPTVMQFFTKLRERLYPVGRLDYQSEGLLLMTNDGELANRLTQAASAVEKTYLVKISGHPTEEELDRLRGGVPIERGPSGSPQVQTAPARIRQVRQGDNPWYEVVLIEGRNRELRKMFQSIGHFVEKIRRVGYGPLILDLEPGKFRELTPQELAALQLAAEGKLKLNQRRGASKPHGQVDATPRSRDLPQNLRGQDTTGFAVKPRRVKTAKILPRETPPAAERSASEPPSRGRKPGFPQTDFGRRSGKPGPPRTDFGWRGGKPGPPQAGPYQRGEKPFREATPSRQNHRQGFENRGFQPRQRPEESPATPQSGRPYRKHGEHSYLHRPARPQSRFDKPFRENYGNRSGGGFGSRPAKSWGPKPEPDQRRGSGSRPNRSATSAPLNRRPPESPSKPGNPGHRNRRGPVRGANNRFRNPGR